MSENTTCEKIKDYKTAFDCFKQRFLIVKKSIFRLNSDDGILNEDSVQFLIDNFIDRGLGGDASFIDKIKMQLIGDGEKFKPVYPENKIDEEKITIQKNAIEILAHCVWLWRLVPYNRVRSSTINSIEEVLKLNDDLKKNIDITNNPYLKDFNGIAKTGTYYNTNKPLEIAFIIKFLQVYLSLKEQQDNGTSEINFINVLLQVKDNKDDNEKYGQVTITTAKDEKGNLLLLNKEEKIIKISSREKESTTKSASIFHAMLHFFAPEKYEAIVSMEHKQAIVKAFKDLIVKENENCKKKFEPEIDWKLHCIKNKLVDELNLSEEGEVTFYHKKIARLWRTQELNLFKNIIYHGAPGTGKTYELKKEIEEHVELYDDGKFEFVQFHGAYTYEDFIGGLRPDIQSTNGLNLKYQNGIFKQLCKEVAQYEIAYYKEVEKPNNELPTKLEDSTILKEKLTIEVNDRNFEIKPNIPVLSQFPPFFILIDEINRADLSKVFGELLFAIEDDYRGFENRFKLSYSAMETEDTAVYWDNTNNEAFFFVPKNLYIRGTMNDIDRSVDSIDFAFRRRFKWVEKKYNPDILQEMLEEKSYANIDEYIKSCDNLNKEILKISIADESFKIGHAVFRNIVKYTKSKNITQESKRELFDNHIESIIYNYLKMDYGNESQNIDNFRDVFIK